MDPGEVEAARTLGMTRWQAFRYIALPQTVNAALPLYKNQFITTMQEPYLDDLNVRILENYSAFIFSKKVDSGWEICIQM